MGLVSAALATSAACSLTSLSGLTGGGADAADSSDAAETGPSSDASSPGDTNLLDAGAPFSCDAQAYAICEDFTDPTFLNHWTSTSNRNTAVAQRDTTAFVSPPASLRAAVPASPTTSAETMLKKTVSLTPQRVEIAFDLFVDTQGAGAGPVAVARLSLGGGNEVAVTVGSTPSLHFNLEESVPLDGSQFYGSFLPSGVAFPAATWVRATVVLSFTGTGTVTGSVAVGSNSASASATHPVTLSSAFEFNLGVQHYSNAPFDAWVVHFDDVTLMAR
jgi:hypothetical protein